jgi:DNA-binding transcriptional regulator YiaG
MEFSMSLVETAPADRALNGRRAISPQVQAFEAEIRSFRPTAKDIHTRIGSAIRRRRRAIEVTLTELAKICGVSFQQVQKYESGACAISAAQLWTMACALGVPVSYFYEGDPTAEA